MDMLKIKLTEAVTDDSIVRLGEVGIHVNLQSSLTIRFRNTSVISWRAVGGDDVGFVTQQGISHSVSSSVSANADNTIVFSSGEYDIFFTRNGLTRLLLNLPAGDYANIIGGWFAGIHATHVTLNNTLYYGRAAKFSDITEGGFASLTIRNDNDIVTLSDDVKFFEDKNPTELVLRKQDLTGNISSFSECTNLHTLSLPFCDGLEGNLLSLSGLVDLTIFLTTSAITGTIEEFADAMWAAGRTSGSINMTITRGSVTYNGDIISTSSHTLTFSSDPNVKWTWN